MHNKQQSVPLPLGAVKHPASEEGEVPSDQFANKLSPFNGPSLPGAIMMTVFPFPSSAHHVAWHGVAGKIKYSQVVPPH